MKDGRDPPIFDGPKLASFSLEFSLNILEHRLGDVHFLPLVTLLVKNLKKFPERDMKEFSLRFLHEKMINHSQFTEIMKKPLGESSQLEISQKIQVVKLLLVLWSRDPTLCASESLLSTMLTFYSGSLHEVDR